MGTSNVEITCDLTGSGESESIHRDEREAGSKYVDLGTKDATENSTGARKMAGFRGYQTIVSGGVLFFFLCSNSAFLEGRINSEQFVKSESGIGYSLIPLLYLLLRPSHQPV